MSENSAQAENVARLRAAIERAKDHEMNGLIAHAAKNKEAADTEATLMSAALWDVWQALKPVLAAHPAIWEMLS